MTNEKIYDKMLNMNTLRKKICIITAIVLILTGICAAFSLSLTKSACADGSVTGERILPLSDFEVREPTAPQSVAFGGGNYAVIHGGNRILLSVDGNVKDVTLADDSLGNPTTPSQVSFFGEKVFFVYDQLIWILNVEDGSYSAVKDDNGDDIRCSFYAVSANRLVALTNDPSIKVYSVSNGEFTLTVKKDNFTQIDGNKPIAINGGGIYCISASPDYRLTRYDFSLTGEPLSLNSIPLNAKSIVANDEYVYFIEGNGVYRIPQSGGEKVDVTPKENTFDLGKLSSPTGLCFKGDNLLITDSLLNAVQEFAVTGDKLEFTGFAVASGKTAYNRIGSVKDSDRYGDNVATLSDKKLTVINTGDGFNRYDKKYFTNLFVGETVLSFALGKDSVVAATADDKLTCVRLGGGEAATVLTVTGYGGIKDVVYQSGYFYYLTYNGSKYYAFRIDEKDFSATEEPVYERLDSANCIAVDVFGGILLGETDFSQLATDLEGRAFGLKTDGKLYYKNERGEWTETGLEGITSFALCFDLKTVYYTTAEAEYLYATDDLNNFAISSLYLPDNYKLSGDSAAPIDENKYKIYKIKDGEKSVNVYLFDTALNAETGKTDVYFKGVTEKEDEYLPVAEFSYGSTTMVMVFLAGKRGVVLVNAKQLVWEERDYTGCDKSVFVTTGVHAYYLPLITKDNIYTLTGADGGSVTLKKDDEIHAEKLLNVLGREFYYATDESGNVRFYIPAEFTVDELAKDYKYSEYRLEKVKATAVYSDAGLTGKIADLEKNAEIRLISEENGVCKIAFYDGENFVEGYVKSSAIINDATTAVRNILIVLAVITCVCGSATFFVLRRKEIS